jgi:hypothetical protein
MRRREIGKSGEDSLTAGQILDIFSQSELGISLV